MAMIVDVYTPTGVITRNSRELALSFDIINRLLEPDDRFCMLHFMRNDIRYKPPKALCVYMSINGNILNVSMGTPAGVDNINDYDDESIVDLNGSSWSGEIDLKEPWGSVIKVLDSFEKVLKIEKNITSLKDANIDDLVKLYNEVSRVFMTLIGCSAFQMLKYVEDNDLVDKITSNNYYLMCRIKINYLNNDMRSITTKLSEVDKGASIEIIYNRIYHDSIIRLFWRLMSCIANRPIYPGEEK